MGVKDIAKTAGGGGYLNGVTGTIQTMAWSAGKTGQRTDGTTYGFFSLHATIQADGAEAATTQFMDAGFLPDDIAVDAAGVLTGSGRVRVDPKSEAYRFLLSYEEAGGADLDDCRDLSAGNNSRVEFKRVIDEEATQKRGKRKGSDGKEYMRDNLLVAAYLGVAPAPVAAKGKATAKATAAPKVSDEALTTEAAAALLDLLKTTPELDVKTLGSVVTRRSVTAPKPAWAASRAGILKTITSADFLASEMGWVYDAAKGTVSAAA